MIDALIGCPGCGVIQEMPSRPRRGRLECWRCSEVLERSSGHSIDAPLACSMATLLLLLPANFQTLMTIHIAGVGVPTYLASGLATSWQQGWPIVTVVLGLQGVVLPFLRFGLLSGTLLAIRLGAHAPLIGRLFRYCELLDRWAMLDVLAIGFGVGYGRIASQIPVTIGTGGWCFLAVALLTLLTRASLDSRAVWQAIDTPSLSLQGDAIACATCNLVLPSDMEGLPCPRCAAPAHRRKRFASLQCSALVIACWVLMPIAYWLPMSEFWEAGTPHPHSIITGIQLLFSAGFWPLAILIICASVGIPCGKLIGLTWFLVSEHLRSSRALRRKTQIYGAIAATGRWSNLDPFTVMIFAPMIRFGQLAHIDVKGGSLAFLSMVVLSMVAAEVFDPRRMWDAADENDPSPVPSLVG